MSTDISALKYIRHTWIADTTGSSKAEETLEFLVAGIHTKNPPFRGGFLGGRMKTSGHR